MTDHYYSKTPSAGHDRHRIDEKLRGHSLSFMSDAGVFSKKGIDYGSKLLIEHMDIPSDAQVLDVGCGYGPIGLFAALFANKGMVTMVDINERAVALARENALLNGLTNVRILQSDLFEGIQNETFSIILTNPPIRAGKKIVHAIYEEAVNRLVVGGELWVVINKKQGAPTTLEKLQLLFTQVDEVAKGKGFRVFRARK